MENHYSPPLPVVPKAFPKLKNLAMPKMDMYKTKNLMKESIQK